MKRLIYFILVFIFVTIVTPVWGIKSFVGFSINNDLDIQIENGLIQHMFNMSKVEDNGRYTIHLDLAGSGFFTMGGVTFYYKNSAAGKTTFKTYVGYIQPDGKEREIWIPTVPGEQVNVALKEACAQILVNGVSRAFNAGNNMLTASGECIILKTVDGYKPKFQSIISLASGSASTEWLPKKLSCAEAVNIGKSLSVGGGTADFYLVTGYISAITGATTDYATYGNETYWITDDPHSTATSNAEGAFQVFRGVAGTPVEVGGRVRILTKIQNYNGLIESESKSVVILIPDGTDIDTEPPVDPQYGDRYEYRYKVFTKSNNCAYGAAIGGGAYKLGTQVTMVAIPTSGSAFNRWSDGVTDNPRLITVTDGGDEANTYTAIFQSIGGGESFNPLDDDVWQTGNTTPGISDPLNPNPETDPKPKTNPNPNPTIFSPEPTIPCGKSIGINFYNKTCVTDPDAQGQVIINGWKCGNCD